MLKHVLKFSRRTTVLLFEIAAFVVVIGALAATLFVWRVSQGPMSIGWAREYVEEALSNKEDDVTVRFDDMVFSWPELKGPFLLDLSGLSVRKGEGDTNSLSIKEASVGLSRGALLFGRIRPVSVIIKSPELELVRTQDGHMSLFYNDKQMQAEEKKAERRPPGEEIAQIFKDMALHKRGSFLSRLDEFQIRGANVAVRDHEFGLSWYLTNLNFVIKEEPQGVAASIKVPLPGGRQQSAGIAIDIVYRKKTDDFRGVTTIRDVNPYVISKFLAVPDEFAGQDLYFTGEIETALDTNFVPTYIKFGGAIPEGTISIPGEFNAPVALKNISIASEYKSDEQALTISTLSGEIGGVAFSGAGKADMEGDTVNIPIRLDVDVAALSQIPPLFPKSEQDGEAYDWLSRKIQGGTFSNVSLDMRLTARKTRSEDVQRDEWDVKMAKMNLNFAFSGAKVQYNDTLLPAEDASGQGSLDLAAQVLEVTGGTARMGDIQGTDVSVRVTDLMTAGAGFVAVKAKLKGPMATALEYIALPPINMGKERIGLDPKNVKGTIEADLDVSLPTVHDVPKDQVKVNISGQLSDLNIPAIVNGLTLSGGPLALATEEGGFTVKGSAQLAGRDVTMDWHQYFESAGNPYSMKIVAGVGADQELRNHFGIDLDDYISGTMPVDVVYTRQGNGDASVDVKGDLGPVRIYIDPFKFEKPVGTPGSIALQAVLKKDVLKALNGVEVKSRNFSVSGAKIGFAPHRGKKADLDSGSLPNVTIGKTKASVTFNVGKDDVMQVKATSPVFDLAPFLMQTEASNLSAKAQTPVKEKKQPMKISLTAATMLAKNDQKATETKSFMAMDEDGDITQIEYDAKIGKGKIMVRFKPDETGKRSFRMQTDDAGGVLYAFGLYENVHGGSLVIYGEPKGGDLRGDLYGSMRMENFRVVKAPALASLLSLMSLSGVGQVLNGEGLLFSKLESGFEWRFRPEGNLLIIKDGKTSGSAIGLTFSGVLDRGRKTTDIAGTIIPITGVNTLLSKVPLIGEILGGASGLIAATYSMKGPSSDPKVSVNPLSVLAPGIIRRILFEGGYESKIPDDMAPPAPQAEKARTPAEKTGPVITPQNKASATPKTNDGAKPVSAVKGKNPTSAKIN